MFNTVCSGYLVPLVVIYFQRPIMFFPKHRKILFVDFVLILLILDWLLKRKEGNYVLKKNH